MIVMTLRGSNPLTVLSWHRSQKIADPMPWPPPHASYWAVSILPMYRVLRLMRSIFTA